LECGAGAKQDVVSTVGAVQLGGGGQGYGLEPGTAQQQYCISWQRAAALASAVAGAAVACMVACAMYKADLTLWCSLVALPTTAACLAALCAGCSNKFKLVILDECDAMTRDAQFALRRGECSREHGDAIQQECMAIGLATWPGMQRTTQS
jgi:hypothetical protein